MNAESEFSCGGEAFRVRAALQLQAALQRLVVLTSNGKVYYKLVEELIEGDMAARIAVIRSRETWLKKRRDRWRDYGGAPQVSPPVVVPFEHPCELLRTP